MSALIRNNTKHANLVKRSLLKSNFGGQEHTNSHNNIINANNSVVAVGIKADKILDEETLLRKAGSQVGRILEGGADLAMAPGRWLNHMQENWLTYLICTTILLVCCLLIYRRCRHKMPAGFSFPTPSKNLSKMAMMQAMEMAALRQAMPDI